MADLFPDHNWGVSNAAVLCSQNGQGDESVPYYAKRADLRPRSPQAAVDAAHALAFQGGNWPQAHVYIQRARRLLEESPSESSQILELPAFEAMEHWQNGDLAPVADTVDNLAGPYWLGTEQRLARDYRKLGRLRLAQAVEADLLKLLAYADVDHPILLEIQKHNLTGG